MQSVTCGGAGLDGAGILAENEIVRAAKGISASAVGLEYDLVMQCAGATSASSSIAWGRVRQPKDITNIVIHTTEGTRSGAIDVARRPPSGQGFDLLIDPGEIGWIAKTNDWWRYISHHAGHWPMNRESIGVEQIGYASQTGNWSDAYYRWAGKVIAELLRMFPNVPLRKCGAWTESGLIAHATVTPADRTDPGSGYRWDLLLKYAKENSGVIPVEPPKPEPEKPAWLPGVERIPFSGYEEKHLDKPRVLTLDGEEKAVIVRKGAAFLVPKAYEDGGVVPEPEPKPEDLERARIVPTINKYFGNDHGAVIYDEAKKANLHITSACALVEQESAGKNIFGADWGTRGADRVPFAHLPVTRDRVEKLVAHVRAGGVSNGVGLTQITWRDFIFDAEKRGGAHLPRNQCAVGFELLAGYYGSYPYLEAIGAYNAGESGRRSVIGTYSAQFAAKHQGWINRLGNVSSNGAGGSVFEGDPVYYREAEEESMNEPKPKPNLSKAAKAVVAACVPVALALILWASTGTLDETELSVGLAGLLTALLVYFVPNSEE